MSLHDTCVTRRATRPPPGHQGTLNKGGMAHSSPSAGCTCCGPSLNDGRLAAAPSQMPCSFPCNLYHLALRLPVPTYLGSTVVLYEYIIDRPLRLTLPSHFPSFLIARLEISLRRCHCLQNVTKFSFLSGNVLHVRTASFCDTRLSGPTCLPPGPQPR